MVDRGSGGISLRAGWRALSLRLAVAAGSLAALVSLFQHAPVSVASLRGAAAYLAVLLVTRLGLYAIERTIVLDAAGGGSGERPPPSDEPGTMERPER